MSNNKCPSSSERNGMTVTVPTDPTPRIALDRLTAIWYGVDHPEGLAIDLDGTIWCGGEEGQVYRGQRDGEPTSVAALPGRTLGFALDAEGNAYCADMTGPGIYRIAKADAAVSIVSTGAPGRPARVPNHP